MRNLEHVKIQNQTDIFAGHNLISKEDNLDWQPWLPC